jgi:NADPH:quinone reductase-like Zn-dependent oxidoreductase
MRAVRLHPEGLSVEDVDVPQPADGEVVVRVHAAGLTRDELTWPTDRLPAIPSYEVCGTAEGLGDVFGLTPFDRDGVAAEFAAVPLDCLAGKPSSLSDVEAAALPLSALSAWQALFDHGGLTAGERVLITGATGGVGHLGVQLAGWAGAHVVAMASDASLADELGAHERFVRDVTAPVDLVVDTAGGERLADALSCLPHGGRLVSVAEEPADVPAGIASTYFIVEPNREQLSRIAELADDTILRPMIDSVFPLERAAQAFDRLDARGKRGKVVLRIDGDA